MSTRFNQALAELLSKPDEVTKAIQGAVREALAEHGRAGRPVVVWREGKVVEISVDDHGDEINAV